MVEQKVWELFSILRFLARMNSTHTFFLQAASYWQRKLKVGLRLQTLWSRDFRTSLYNTKHGF